MRYARAAALVEWKRTVHARGRRRLTAAVAAAAAIVVLGGSAWMWTKRSSPPLDRPELATVQRIVGSVRIIDASDRPVDAASGRRLKAGDRIDVAEGRAAFELLDGTSVRLAGTTLVRLDANNRLQLERGMVYVDVNPLARGNAARVDTRVETPFGTVRHVGTQFELRLQPDSLAVRVREGEVVVESRDAKLTSRAGEAVVITRDRPPLRST